MKYSIAVAALLSIISYNDVAAINSKTAQNLVETGKNKENVYAELGRFINSKGEPINLAQETGHARLELTKVRKFVEPVDITDLQMQACDEQAKKEKDAPLNLLEEGSYDEITHCPINKTGDKVQAHIEQANLEDNAYISDMYIGTPPQKIRGLFDTGSTNTWILNKNTKLGNDKEKEFAYNDSASTTKKKTEQKAIIQFGSGALGGHFFTDDIRLGSCDSKSSGQIHIKNQKFGNVEKQKTIFTGSNFEAIVGMAYPSLAEKNVKPVFDEMMDQKLLKNNLFAFYLTTKQAESKGMKSDLTLGYYDKEKFKGELNWNPVQYKYMYGVKLDDLKVNNKSTGVCEGKKCLITFDSGTSLMSIPTFATHKLIEQGIPTANHVVKCKDSKDFGEMALAIGGKDYKLNNDEWMFPSQKTSLSQGGKMTVNFSMGPLGPQIMAQIGSGHELYLDAMAKPPVDTTAQLNTDIKRRYKNSRKSGLDMSDDIDGDDDNSSYGQQKGQACASTIMKMDISHDMFLVGDVFMRKFYTVFDRDNNQVGLAEANTSDKIKALSQQDL